MKIKIIEEEGFNAAMKGLALSYGRDPKDMPKVAMSLGKLDRGHNKFLESMVVWMEVDAPLDFWSQFDTYRVGMTKQSESTMHTLKDRPLLQEDFEVDIPSSYLSYINSCIDGGAPLTHIKKLLPCGFLQMRVVCTNYKALRNIIVQRASHTLPEWKKFCEAMKDLRHYEYMGLTKSSIDSAIEIMLDKESN